MKRISLFLTVFMVFKSLLLLSEDSKYKYINKVDLFTCTADDYGQLDPAACVPFGMVKLGPETDPDNHSGYNYNAKKIKGFTHNRLGGVGCSGAGGNVLVKPGIGKLKDSSMSFDKTSEKAHPGYYVANLSEYGILAEMTANNHVGFHRYTFTGSDKSYILFDFEYTHSKLISFDYEILDNKTIKGVIKATNNCNVGVYTTHFSIKSSKGFTEYVKEKGKVYGLFSTKAGEVVTLQVALSPISTEQADKDRKNSIGTKSFDEVKESAEEKWEKILGRIEVSGEGEYEKLFYTHLYHSCLMPVNSTSTSGTFKGTDGNIYEAKGYIHYDGWSIWDTFRSKLPLISLLYPEIYQDFSKSLTDLYRYGKYAWAGENEPVPTCRTEHTTGILLDAFRKGMSFDFETAYNGMLSEADTLPYKSPDNILETSYDYWVISQMALELNKNEDHKVYQNKAARYKKIWKEKFLVMDEKSDIMHGDGLYEGTLWQYRWFVPFDYDGVFEMMGGKTEFTKQLEYFFENDLYNHGNQPDIHAPFLFNYSDSPWLTQNWVNKILTKPMIQHYGTHDKWEKPYYGRIYKLQPEGYIEEMDDDAGTMSAWYVLASVGLFQVCVGDPVYQISTPIFDEIVIHLKSENTLKIKVKNLSENSYFIQGIKLNGKEYNKSYLSHDDIMKGGTVVFELGQNPNKKWGTGL